MPKLREVTGGPKERFILNELLWRYILASLRTVILGLTKVGNQAKPLKYSKKKTVFCTNLEQMYKLTATDLNIQPITTQQRLSC
jgi:hypothetical protein